MERHFHMQLDHLKMTLLKMTALAQQLFEQTLQAFIDNDEALAMQVIDNDSQVNQFEIDIDELTLKLLALGQPMAKDLRFIIGALKISNDVERIADQAVNIAERVLFFSQYPLKREIPIIFLEFNVIKEMLKKAIVSLVNMDIKTAIDVRQMDDEADLLTLQVLKNEIEYMKQDKPISDRKLLMEQSTQLIITSRCLERIGDLSTNIAEYVAFIVSGTNIKHNNMSEL